MIKTLLANEWVKMWLCVSFTLIHIHTHTYTYIHTHSYTIIQSYTHTLIHSYTHTHTHTYIHSYTHTHTLSLTLSRGWQQHRMHGQFRVRPTLHHLVRIVLQPPELLLEEDLHQLTRGEIHLTYTRHYTTLHYTTLHHTHNIRENTLTTREVWE